MRSDFGATSARRPRSRPAFQAARGDLVFTLDGDLQDDPAEIPRFLAELDKGYDVVSGWKKTRHDPWHKVYPSRVFNWMVSGVSGCRLHDHNCGFKLYRKRGACARSASTASCTGSSRSWRMPGAFGSREIEVRHRSRRHGVSKYGFSRFFKGFLDLLTVRFLTRFRQRPLHVLGRHGPGTPGPGLCGMLYLAVLWLDPANRPIGERPLLFYSIAFFVVGAQLLSLGVLAELVTAYNIRAEDTYSVAETIPAANSEIQPEP